MGCAPPGCNWCDRTDLACPVLDRQADGPVTSLLETSESVADDPIEDAYLTSESGGGKHRESRWSRIKIAPLASRRRPQTLIALWVAAVLAGMGLVVYGLGPLFEQRDQRTLMRDARADINRSANEASGLAGVTVPTKGVAPGRPVGILEVGAIKLQQVVVEGVGPVETRHGPGHVPGTAGLGQPGNSVVVGRNKMFGGPFGGLGDLHKGNKAVVTTTQGQSLYQISSIRHMTLRSGSKIDNVYGPSKDDRITLVTSNNALPWNESSATVVVAKMQGTAFAPTPQGARLDSDIGTQRDRGAMSSIVLALVLYGLAISASLLIYRRFQARTAYLLTIGPVLAATIIAAETISRAFPAWI